MTRSVSYPPSLREVNELLLRELCQPDWSSIHIYKDAMIQVEQSPENVVDDTSLLSPLELTRHCENVTTTDKGTLAERLVEMVQRGYMEGYLPFLFLGPPASSLLTYLPSLQSLFVRFAPEVPVMAPHHKTMHYLFGAPYYGTHEIEDRLVFLFGLPPVPRVSSIRGAVVTTL